MTFTSIDQSLLGPFTSAGATFLGVGRNRILNGAMDIDQVNGGSSVLISTGGTQYTLDMWASLGGGGQFTAQRVSASPPIGFQNYMRHTVTTADASPSATAYYFTQQLIEGYNTRDFGFGAAGAKTITVSFWARCSLTGTFGGAVLNGNDGRANTFSYPINNANTWEYKTITIAGDTTGTWNSLTTSANMKLVFDLGTGSNRQTAAGVWTSGQFFTPPGMTKIISTLSATLDITGVQLELGATATPFEFKPFALELWLVQRYYEKSYGRDTNPGAVTSAGIEHVMNPAVGASETWGVSIHFQAAKRIAPNMTYYNGTTGANGTWNTTSSTGVTTTTPVTTQYSDFRYFGVHNTSNNNQYAEGHWTADARL